MAKLPTKKIVTAIPVDEIPATAARIEQAIKFLTELDRKLRDTKDARTSSIAGDVAALGKSMGQAIKT
jgi:hypothetical protein